MQADEMTERENIYYYTESVRIAMRVDEVITWLLSDHINSTSITVDGAVQARRVGSNFEPTIKCFGYSLFEISKIEAGRSKNRHVRNEKDGTDL